MEEHIRKYKQIAETGKYIPPTLEKEKEEKEKT